MNVTNMLSIAQFRIPRRKKERRSNVNELPTLLLAALCAPPPFLPTLCATTLLPCRGTHTTVYTPYAWAVAMTALVTRATLRIPGAHQRQRIFAESSTTISFYCRVHRAHHHHLALTVVVANRTTTCPEHHHQLYSCGGC